MLDQNLRPQTETIKIRCPKCLKPFAVREHLITHKEPSFSCNKCETQFWIPFHQSKGLDEFLGIEIQTPKIEKEQPALQKFPQLERTCPKCGAINEQQKKECGSCGIVIAKYELISKESEPKIPVHILESWQDVIGDYENLQTHSFFVNKCLKLKHLNFAIKKYSEILTAYSGDEMALKMKKRLVILTQTSVGYDEHVKPTHIKIKKIKRRLVPKIFLGLIGVGIVLFLVGQYTQGFKNLMGVGAALVFISITLSIYLR
jgi:hypothetical protein